MASIQPRVSKGKKYWSIVESRRINGQPRTAILEYLGTADSLLQRLRDENKITLKSYRHGDVMALLNAAQELDVVQTINRHIPPGPNGKKQLRDNLTVGASFLLAAIGRACHPTSKLGWYEWARETSLEYCLKSSFKDLDSQHFWDQMDALPVSAIPLIEKELVAKLAQLYPMKQDCLFFDTTNFFTFIDSANQRCQLPRRGNNKQKRFDLRQVGMALLVTREDQFPLFHQTYAGHKNDMTIFSEVFHDLFERIKQIFREVAEITLVFDKGNNSRSNFRLLDEKEDCHYVAGLVPAYFRELIQEANRNFTTLKIEEEEIPVFRVTKSIWGSPRTCVITVSSQLKEGQIRGIHQHLEKKYRELQDFKEQLENPKRRKRFTKEEIETRLKKIIKGQFVEEILKCEFITLAENTPSFTYAIDGQAFQRLKEEVLGRQIVVTNRHDWSNEEILLAYRGQAKIEYAFRNLKNPYHLAVRPQYHWTDQKIEVHFSICIIGYLLTMAVYAKARRSASYRKNVGHLLQELASIRLACRMKNKSTKVQYQLEQIPESLAKVAPLLGVSDDQLRPRLEISDYA